MMSKSGSTVSLCQAHISFSPTMEQQRKCPGCDGTIIDGDFIIKYDVNREASLGDIQVGARPSSRIFERLLLLFFTSSFHCGLFIILAWSALLCPPSGCKRLLCALLCSAWSAQRPEERDVCDRQEWIDERYQNPSGNGTTLVLISCKRCIFDDHINLTDTRGNDCHPATTPRGRPLWHHCVWLQQYILEGQTCESNQGKPVRGPGTCQKDNSGWRFERWFRLRDKCHLCCALTHCFLWLGVFLSLKEPTSTMQSWQQYHYWPKRGSRETSQREASTWLSYWQMECQTKVNRLTECERLNKKCFIFETDFYSVSHCICCVFWRRVQNPEDPGKRTFGNWRKHVFVLSRIW